MGQTISTIYKADDLVCQMPIYDEGFVNGYKQILALFPIFHSLHLLFVRYHLYIYINSSIKQFQ